jgi:hypothetical protein
MKASPHISITHTPTSRKVCLGGAKKIHELRKLVTQKEKFPDAFERTWTGI